jgi:hypothetical protein
MAPMPGRQPEDWGIALWEAIERWTPRELWERYRELAEYDIPLIIPGAEDPRSEEVRRLRSGITEILVNRLARGELIASGIAVPLKETSRRRDIRPELWCRLAFSSGFSMVTGNGLKYDRILIREASPVRHDVPASWQDTRRPQPPSYRAAARPGRPSIMPMIEAEMRCRAARGLIERSLGREAEVLAMWAQQQFADAHVPKPESIERKLGQVYKELKRTKRPDK